MQTLSIVRDVRAAILGVLATTMLVTTASAQTDVKIPYQGSVKLTITSPNLGSGCIADFVPSGSVIQSDTSEIGFKGKPFGFQKVASYTLSGTVLGATETFNVSWNENGNSPCVASGSFAFNLHVAYDPEQAADQFNGMAKGLAKVLSGDLKSITGETTSELKATTSQIKSATTTEDVITAVDEAFMTSYCGRVQLYNTGWNASKQLRDEGTALFEDPMGDGSGKGADADSVEERCLPNDAAVGTWGTFDDFNHGVSEAIQKSIGSLSKSDNKLYSTVESNSSTNITMTGSLNYIPWQPLAGPLGVGGMALEPINNPLRVNVTWAATDQDSGDNWIWAGGIADSSLDDNVFVSLHTTDPAFTPIIDRPVVIDPVDNKWYAEFGNVLGDALLSGSSYRISVRYEDLEDADEGSDALYGRISFSVPLSF